MKKEQALAIIKEALDLSIGSGVFKNMDDLNLLCSAFETLKNSINDSEKEIQKEGKTNV